MPNIFSRAGEYLKRAARRSPSIETAGAMFGMVEHRIPQRPRMTSSGPTQKLADAQSDYDRNLPHYKESASKVAEEKIAAARIKALGAAAAYGAVQLRKISVGNTAGKVGGKEMSDVEELQENAMFSTKSRKALIAWLRNERKIKRNKAKLTEDSVIGDADTRQGWRADDLIAKAIADNKVRDVSIAAANELRDSLILSPIVSAGRARRFGGKDEPNAREGLRSLIDNRKPMSPTKD